MTKCKKYGIKSRLERVFSRIAYTKDIGFFYEIILFPLYLLSLVYGALVKTRLALYSTGLFKAAAIDCKVISIGNITVGGTGKTPTVEFVAGRLQEKGLKVAILSRGYKRKGRGNSIVSDGKGILLEPEMAGDEPYMLARRLRGIQVLVGEDRYVLGRYALERFPLDVIVLDDGYQHVRLKRDLDILLIDGEKGFGNGCLIPRGPLREPLSGIDRAELVLINKASTAGTEMVEKAVRHAPLFSCSYRPERLLSLWENEAFDVERLKGAKVMAVSGIATPSSFLNLLSSLGAKVIRDLSFQDHYDYTLDDLEEIICKARECEAELMITTEKDAVKLERLERRADIPFYYLEIGLDMYGKEEEFMNAVLSGIQK